MKKEYIAPEVNVVKVHAERMLAGSDDPTTVNQTPDPTPITDPNVWADAREFSFFEEENEE